MIPPDSSTASKYTMNRKPRDGTSHQVSANSERHHLHRNRHSGIMKIARLSAAIALAILVLLSLSDSSFLSWTNPRWSPTNATPPLNRLNKKEEDGFNWANITSSPPPIQWQSCFDNELDCARLDLPMDWQQAEATNDSTSGRRVILAINRLRAAVPSNSPDYRGPIIFNPGGPGGSGIWSLRDHGKDLQTIVGTNYDIISWDPRGIGASTPRIDCWASAQDRVYWDLQDPGVIDAHEGTVYDAFARAAAYSQVCERNLEESGILEHSSTAYHARDLLAILEAMGEEKLKYWGFSYGTVLGGTFAAMYPDRVGRMVNDGNVDYEEWYNGTYLNFLHDTDKVMEAFYTFCHSAGPHRCPFHASSPLAIKSRLDALLTKLRTHPILIPQSQSPSSADRTEPYHVPSLVTYSHIRRMLSTALYQPILRFRQTALVLSSLEAGDALPYHHYTLSDTHPPGPPSSPPTTCQADDILPRLLIFEEESNPDASSAVMCSDALPFTSTPRDFALYAQHLLNMSQAAGAVQASFRLSCAGRTVRPRWDPLDASSLEVFKDVKTAHPVLFINNEYDNVTPLISARRNARRFRGARVLVQRGSWGHTSLAAPSVCMARAVRGYFEGGMGEVPGEGRECWGDVVPFGDGEDGEEGVERRGGDGDEDGELSRAVWRLARRRRRLGGF
ncbi:Alpha/Beta hydrolase protein [Copromyces sp. CBS 386.78]|nr:Alpha/Beta hydrolase protein [Copromyces sp. CBS 386.78]